MTRATIQAVNRACYPYDIGGVQGADYDHRTGLFTSLLFGQPADVRELPNIVKFEWQRDITQDVATAKLTLMNSELVAIGELPPEGYGLNYFEQPGALTFTHGSPWSSASEFGYGDTGWREILVPDRMIRTYEGYGCDPTVFPADDEHLCASGVWLIDDVIYGADGTIEIDMRDVGRTLLDQQMYVEVVPRSLYPVSWKTRIWKDIHYPLPEGGAWRNVPGRATSSNVYYAGHPQRTSDHSQFCDAHGNWQGHVPNNVLVNNNAKMWVSCGEMWPDGNTRVWWEHTFSHPQNIAALRLTAPKGAQTAYISVKIGGKWQGARTIPYKKSSSGIDVQANIPYVMTAPINGFDSIRQLPLPRVYKNVQAVRITLGALEDWGVDRLHPWRGALTSVAYYTGSAQSLKFGTGTQHLPYGNIDDFSDIIRTILAWGGFFWPEQYTHDDYETKAPGERTFYHQTKRDKRISRGNLWADIMDSGTAPFANIPPSTGDKQPLMTTITTIADQIGFIKFVDEVGGFVWRMPNIWSQGNWRSPADNQGRDQGGSSGNANPRTTDYITIRDDETLKQFKLTASSQNVRERIYVAATRGTPGTIVDGFNPFPAGMRRIAGWIGSGQGGSVADFATIEEVETMASLIATRQKFQYLTATITIPGNPAIQIDDQVRVIERITNTDMFHYVNSISSTMDMRAGTWDYTLGTNWLGDDKGKWVVSAQTDLAPGEVQRLVAAGLW